VDAAVQYRQLLQLGRDEFLAASAPAALVRQRIADDDDGGIQSGLHTLTIDDDALDYADDSVDATRPHGNELPDGVDLEVYPLAKKPGASFPDRITIGRTSNNDVVIPDTSVSRLHAYVRRDAGRWLVADAGSKNGSWLHGVKLEARREQPLVSRTVLRLGDVDLTFYLARDLYAALGGG
jgi:hypothetical protein